MADPPYTLPYFNIAIPFPPSDLIVALVAVLGFLPAVVVLHYLISALPFRKKKQKIN
jgi:hypothetical protein